MIRSDRETDVDTRVPHIVAYSRWRPQIDIDLEERSSRDIVRAVAGSLADIGIVGDEVNPAKERRGVPGCRRLR
jgi:hypothetical protein